MAGGAALIYLIERAQLKRRRLGGILGRLPSLGTLDRLVYHATLLGLPFLTMGMVAGVIRAVTFRVPQWWGRSSGAGRGRVVRLCHPSLGPHGRGWGGSQASWLAIVGLVVLLVIRFVALPYLSDFHTWGG